MFSHNDPVGTRLRSRPLKPYILSNKELETAAQACLNGVRSNLTMPLSRMAVRRGKQGTVNMDGHIDNCLRAHVLCPVRS